MRTRTLILLLLILVACQKEEANPFDALDRRSPVAEVDALPTGNFAWIHQRILRPSCALSGCHDGTFEPEFRSIGSSYHSLVYHPVIANDPQLSYTYRVLPGDVQASFLHARLNTFVPNTSGTMPLELPEGSDWPANAATYRAAIDAWIAAGAADMFGTLPTAGNLVPQVSGILAFSPGTTSAPWPRAAGDGIQAIEVPAGEVDLWFAFEDDATPSSALGYNKLSYTTSAGSTHQLDLLTSSSLNGPDLSGTSTTYTHHARIALGDLAPGTRISFQVQVDDGDHDGPTVIPGAASMEEVRDFFTMIIAE